jgi:hypothetical protein
MGDPITLAPPAAAHGLGAAVCKEHLAALIGSVLIVVHVVRAFMSIDLSTAVPHFQSLFVVVACAAGCV